MWTRRASLWIAAVAVTATTGTAAVVALGGPGTATTAGSTSSVSTSTATSSASASPASTTSSAAATTSASAFRAAVAKAVGSSDAAVAVEDLSTGTTWTSGSGSYDTASIVKVDIIATLMLQAQDAGRSLTASEKSLAAAMIEQSDNTAATALFDEVGGKSGIEAANERLGITGVTIGSDGYWGLSQTTAAGQLTVLEAVFGADTPLTSASTTYITSLMESVISTQHFGVSAAADDPSAAALKVGFLQRSTTGLWDVNSIGRIEVDGTTYLVAVLSKGDASYDDGVALTNAVAKAAVDAATG